MKPGFRNLQIFAWALLLLSFAMIVLGGVVHNTGSSLACPDWPLCFGQVFPKMEGAVAIEHSHRLLGTLIGLLCIGLVVVATRKKIRETTPSLTYLSWILLAVVIFQGVLGGVTVLLRLSPLVSTAHLATSQIFLGLILWLLFNTRGSTHVHYSQRPESRPPAKILPLQLLLVGVVFLQMCWGAFIRHGGASVACGLGTEAMILCQAHENFEATFWPTFIQAQVHMLHRYLGVFTGLLTICGTLPLLKWAQRHKKVSLARWIYAADFLVLAQIMLGILTIATFIHPFMVTLHLLFGVLLWICVLWQAFSLREYSSRMPLQGGAFLRKDMRYAQP